MPLIARDTREHGAATAAAGSPASPAHESGAKSSRTASLFSHCANPQCATGWMQMWRSRRAPAFEGRWACSAGCMEEIVRSAVRRETGGPVHPYAHRLPLGLTLIEQGRITQEDLRHAIVARENAAQAGGETVPLGAWLVESGILNETMLTRALSAQWSCPVYSLEGGYRPAEVATALPRILAEAFGAVPLRAGAGGTMYVAFANRIDRSLTYAMERMLGRRVTSGVLRDSEFLRAQGEYLDEPGPPVKFLEAPTAAALARLLTRRIEQERPADAQLVGVHEYCWLRMWKQAARGGGMPRSGEVEDVLCTVGQNFGAIRTENA